MLLLFSADAVHLQFTTVCLKAPCFLTFLPEIIQAKRSRRLLVTAVAHACENKDDNRHDIRQDLVKLLRDVSRYRR